MKSACAGRGAFLRVLRVLVGQWFRYQRFDTFKVIDVDLVLELLAIVRAAEGYWGARSDLDWVPNKFGKRILSVLSASAPLR